MKNIYLCDHALSRQHLSKTTMNDMKNIYPRSGTILRQQLIFFFIFYKRQQ